MYAPLRLDNGVPAMQHSVCWLACPLLDKAVDKLERSGALLEFQAREGKPR